MLPRGSPQNLRLLCANQLSSWRGSAAPVIQMVLHTGAERLQCEAPLLLPVAYCLLRLRHNPYIRTRRLPSLRIYLLRVIV